MKLYEIADSVKALATDLESMDLDESTIKDTLDGSAELVAFEDKAAAVIFILKNVDSDVEQIDAEIKRLSDMKRVRQSNADRLKSYLLTCMQAAELAEIKAGTLTLKRQKNPPSVSVEQGANLPTEYIKTTITQVPDKTAIKNALKAGAEVPGCMLVQSERLVIK